MGECMIGTILTVIGVSISLAFALVAFVVYLFIEYVFPALIIISAIAAAFFALYYLACKWEKYQQRPTAKQAHIQAEIAAIRRLGKPSYPYRLPPNWEKEIDDLCKETTNPKAV